MWHKLLIWFDNEKLRIVLDASERKIVQVIKHLLKV